MTTRRSFITRLGLALVAGPTALRALVAAKSPTPVQEPYLSVDMGNGLDHSVIVEWSGGDVLEVSLDGRTYKPVPNRGRQTIRRPKFGEPMVVTFRATKAGQHVLSCAVVESHG